MQKQILQIFLGKAHSVRNELLTLFHTCLNKSEPTSLFAKELITAWHIEPEVKTKVRTEHGSQKDILFHSILTHLPVYFAILVLFLFKVISLDFLNLFMDPL